MYFTFPALSVKTASEPLRNAIDQGTASPLATVSTDRARGCSVLRRWLSPTTAVAKTPAAKDIPKKKRLETFKTKINVSKVY
jgi:hypothetical protein